MALSHTKSPWKRRPGTSIIGAQGQPDVCIVVGSMVGGEFVAKRDADNARLIEQAPEMLKALVRCYEWLCTGEAQSSPYHRKTYNQVQEVLKAIYNTETP